MRVGVIAAGYVGLVAGTCMAEMGNDVIVADAVASKIEALQAGRIPIYEPGLEELVGRNHAEGRLTFTTALEETVGRSTAVFLAVGTPQGEDGAANLSFIEAAACETARAMDGYRLLIIKSTVPVGTNQRLSARIAEHTTHPFDLVSNPEFLKEGAAVEDFMRPDRVVVGVRSERAARLMEQLYAPFVRTGRPIMVTDPESAEMIKYVSNALLASRISFMNETAAICSAMGADVDMVRRGVGADHRIGPAFLFPGLGYGGSCFPKDVRALVAVAESLGLDAPMCRAIDAVNKRQRDVLMPKILEACGESLNGRTFALWGLAFKPRTDDMREAPSVHIARELTKRGAAVNAFDPVAMTTAREELGDTIAYAGGRYEALDGADALVICTEWNEFRSPDFEEMAKRMQRPLIFDGRNLYDRGVLREAGFTYYSVGRPPVLPD
jgi:UDPglucose 6-dehydrogenase